MNPTPSDEAAGPSPEAARPDAAASGAADPAVPVPRSSAHPLPRRIRNRTAAHPLSERERGHDPDGRPYDRMDEETLSRLLGGLRDI
jgi:hypothetical protein